MCAVMHAGGPKFRDEMCAARSYTRAHATNLEFVHDFDFNFEPALRFKADSTVCLKPAAEQGLVDTSAGPAGAG